MTAGRVVTDWTQEYLPCTRNPSQNKNLNLII